MLKNDFIKINRDIVNWKWYKEPLTVMVFIHLILTSNYDDDDSPDSTIKRGQRVLSYATLAEETGLSIQDVRTALKHLISSGAIVQEQKGKYIMVTVNGYSVSDTGEVTLITPSENNHSFDKGSCRQDVSCGVYQYVYKGEVIYIGKSDSSINNRIKAHAQEAKFQPFLNECEIYYSELSNPAFTTIYETYLINKYKPRLNVMMKYEDDIPFDLPELNWQKYKAEKEV